MIESELQIEAVGPVEKAYAPVKSPDLRLALTGFDQANRPSDLCPIKESDAKKIFRRLLRRNEFDRFDDMTRLFALNKARAFIKFRHANEDNRRVDYIDDPEDLRAWFAILYTRRQFPLRININDLIYATRKKLGEDPLVERLHDPLPPYAKSNQQLPAKKLPPANNLEDLHDKDAEAEEAESPENGILKLTPQEESYLRVLNPYSLFRIYSQLGIVGNLESFEEEDPASEAGIVIRAITCILSAAKGEQFDGKIISRQSLLAVVETVLLIMSRRKLTLFDIYEEAKRKAAKVNPESLLNSPDFR